MTALGAPAREAPKLVAGFMHFLADCLEETAGVESKPAGPTIHIDNAVFHTVDNAEAIAKIQADQADAYRKLDKAAARADQAALRRTAARERAKQSRRRPWWHAFVPDRGPGDQADYALAGRK